MNNYLENLKNKPDHIKKRFAFVTSLSVTLIIFMGWMVSYSLKSQTAVLADAPASSLTANVSNIFKDIKNIFSSNKVEFDANDIEVTGGTR